MSFLLNSTLIIHRLKFVRSKRPEIHAKNVEVKIRLRSKNSYLNSEMRATNLLIMDHFPLLRSMFLLLMKFSPVIF